jgi:hypothetical protein
MTDLTLKDERVSPVARIIIIATTMVALVLLYAVITEGVRMINGRPLSGLHEKLLANRVAVTAEPCVRVAPTGTNPFFQPIGNCEFLLPDYAAAPAYSMFTRHSIVGPLTPWRVFVDGMHLFGALSTVVFLTVLGVTHGMRGRSRLNELARKFWLGTTYTMWLTGFAMYRMQQDADTGFFPRITPADMPWLRHALFVAFSISFVNVVCHANLFRPAKVKPLIVQHIISVMAWVPLLVVLFYRLFTLDRMNFEWMYTVELLSLVTLYPVLDAVNGWVLYRTQVAGRPYDWDEHRHDNYIIYVLMVVSTVLFMIGFDRHYFFATQLPPVYRLAFTLAGTVGWVGSGAFFRWVRRAARA